MKLLAAILGLALFAQDDTEKIRKRILEEVEKRLRVEEERILKEVEKIIDEELSRSKRGEKKTNVETGRPYLGVHPVELSDEERKELGVASGVRVREVKDGSPAAKVLMPGDVIVKIDGRPIDDLETLRVVLQARKPGDTLKIEYLRNGKSEEVSIVLARHPEDAEPKREEPRKDEGRDSLRERIKKFLDREERKETPKDEKKQPEKKSEEGDDFFALDDEMFDQIRPLLEQFGLNPEEYFEKGKDGKWRPNEQLREMFKQFDFRRFFEREKPPEKKEEKRDEKKVEKKEEKKAEKKEEKKAETPKPAWLGIVPAELSDDDRAQLDLEAGVGLLVAEVRPGSPAEKAGLKKGDLLLKIDGKKVRGEEFLQKFIASAKAGQECEVTVSRSREEKKIKVTLGERKD